MAAAGSFMNIFIKYLLSELIFLYDIIIMMSVIKNPELDASRQSEWVDYLSNQKSCFSSSDRVLLTYKGLYINFYA